ncbi:hypothetical protein WN48_05566 [Eufriesea mexicana]|uniref:Uncharacterized protein n=1 Tax=Eufriesea mexicana TaxID=516756 RepID=A0A310S986_9HYME|nr:hypothetical protein WN48_05566 [Eufriesea mexicana]
MRVPESSYRLSVGGVRSGLNISERLKTNDTRAYRKRRYFEHIRNKIWIRYVNFCQFYTPLNMEGNQVHFRHLVLSKAKMPHKRQTKYALFMTKVL